MPTPGLNACTFSFHTAFDGIYNRGAPDQLGIEASIAPSFSLEVSTVIL